MLMSTENPSRPRPKLYALGARDVRPDTMKLVDEVEMMLKQNYRRESIARAIETAVLKALNEERKELSALARELNLDSSHPEIRAAATRMGPSACADVALNVARSALARLCAERISTLG